ncbi:YihY/virulence factor BrkB family protein [Frankia sp. R82]|uniref:YihY/virulence factor BrkB family protein n=1 Tax=Frankia sp. R82 TaxID=2950553 RepID=UPI002042F9FF|nr:YihY/virulence factor BrkB family protein [Frankia sp. R82]MCM3884731.1 YihY/virulence factor BrkB family protein [Frankia sp. R82]
MVALRRRRGQRTELAVGTGPDDAVERAAPDRLHELPAASWWAVLRRTVTEFNDDALSDRAAALTYYAIQAIFPALLVLVSLLGVVGKSATTTILDNVEQLTPGSARDIVRDAVNGIRDSGGTGGVVALIGLAGAVWSASGYVAAFIRAANAVYDIPEGRPAWKIAPLRVAVTVAMMVLLALSAVIVVFSGGVARQAGAALGLGQTAVDVWSYAKWPVLVFFVILMIALLYWSAPNVRHHGFRWVTPGSGLALAIWMAASAGFAFYVANFGSYNKTYGTLAGVIIFLVWLWLTNLAILLGLEFDAELARQRAIAGGQPESVEPYTRPRDTRGWPRRVVRRSHRPAGGTSTPDAGHTA